VRVCVSRCLRCGASSSTVHSPLPLVAVPNESSCYVRPASVLESSYGGCSRRTHSFRDQLDGADAGSWQIADRGDLWTARAQVTSVGDLRVRFVVEL
jgi:hypothetical protein